MVEAKAMAAQVGVFLVGLAISLVVGMFLAAQLDGPGGLLVSTVVAGGGLLGAAVGSQLVHDHLISKALDEMERPPDRRTARP